VGPVIAIEGIGDDRVGDYRNLTDAALRRAPTAPEGPGTFIVEGTLAIRQLVRSRYPVRSLLVTAAKLDALAADLDAVAAPVYVASRATMAGVAGFDVHRGALASAARLPAPPVDAVVAGARVVVVLEGINDHENLGALFRNAAAFGVDGVLLCPRTADPLYRRSVRVSVGHVLHVPWTRVGRWPDGLTELRSAGFELIALTPDPAAVPLPHFTPGAGRCALVVGAEGAGLSEAALAAADRRVRVPMSPGADSVNVATAAAIAFYHLASRQPASDGPASHRPALGQPAPGYPSTAGSAGAERGGGQ
jgi:tRNA G18 (ribose-2'-O)-methylase SpoU